MLNFLRKKTMQTGALVDDRPIEEKEHDYVFAETVASTNPVVYTERDPAQWRKFPIFNQDGSGSCVAQAMAKLMGILYWLQNKTYVHFSATHIYQRRANRPAAGMGAVDVFSIARKGVTLEVLAPSQDMNDVQMDNVEVEEYKKKVGEIFKTGNYVELPLRNMDTVASTVLTTGKGVMVWFYFKIDEWTDFPKVKYQNLPLVGDGVVRHAVVVVDVARLNGVEGVIIEDSWGTSFGMAGQRFISRDFFEKRNYYAGYPIAFKFNEDTIPVPSPEKFTMSMQFIPWDNDNNQPLDVLLHNKQKAQVVLLQNFLKQTGHYPTNISSTGYYGSITSDSVLKFQLANNVDNRATLLELKGRHVGPKTLAVLNKK